MTLVPAVAGISFGPIAAFIPELFTTRCRYSGSALAMNVASVAGGAVPPLIAGTLQTTYGSWSISLMLATVRKHASAEFSDRDFVRKYIAEECSPGTGCPTYQFVEQAMKIGTLTRRPEARVR